MPHFPCCFLFIIFVCPIFWLTVKLWQLSSDWILSYYLWSYCLSLLSLSKLRFGGAYCNINNIPKVPSHFVLVWTDCSPIVQGEQHKKTIASVNLCQSERTTRSKSFSWPLSHWLSNCSLLLTTPSLQSNTLSLKVE